MMSRRKTFFYSLRTAKRFRPQKCKNCYFWHPVSDFWVNFYCSRYHRIAYNLGGPWTVCFKSVMIPNVNPVFPVAAWEIFL